MNITEKFFTQVPIDLCRKHGLCLSIDGDKLLFRSTCKPFLIDGMRRFIGTPLEGVEVDEALLSQAIDQGFERFRVIRSHDVEMPEGAENRAILAGADDAGDLLKDRSSAPVVELVNQILFEAVQQQASDVHFQPDGECLVVRMRMDGVLFDVRRISKSIQDEVLTRLKVAGRMDIAEKRLPQDGRATVNVGSRIIDLRIASMPSSHGERVVVRLLDKSARLYRLPELGMDPFSLERFRKAIAVEHGLILVTGPTGSGKSTTLYSALKELDTRERNAVTLEDPIEYQLDGISQTQINLKKGMTFASGLRSVLRQDPDIIMVGEIRDSETAMMAVQAALTGHLVFSTLHTNDAASAVTRLLDLGIEPYLLASSLVAVLAQRLVRRLCEDCRKPINASDENRIDTEEMDRATEELAEKSALDSHDPRILPDSKESFAVGCQRCRQTGYRGRFGIYELLVVDEPIRSLITRRSHSTEIRDSAISRGMRLLSECGDLKVAEGETSREEVQRVTMRATM